VVDQTADLPKVLGEVVKVADLLKAN
jgi:hypothetical protein